MKVPHVLKAATCRRQWAAATLAAQPDPPYITDFIDLVAERARPARIAVRDTA